MALLGATKKGKTYTATTIGEDSPHFPWLIWNVDRPSGTAAIRKPAGCAVVDLTARVTLDPDNLVKAIDAELARPHLSYKTYILDSFSFFMQQSVVLPKVVQAGSYQQVGHVGWGDIYIDSTTVLMKMRALQSRGANIIVTCHVDAKVDPKTRNADPSKQRYNMENALPGKAHAFFGMHFDVVGYLDTKPSFDPKQRPKHVLYTASVGNFDAGNSYEEVIDETGEPVIPVEFEQPRMDDLLARMDKARQIMVQE